MSKTTTPPAKQAIIEVLKVEPTATAAQIAVSVDIGRSTASKMLAQLESDGKVRRAEGGRDGKRRLPDVWSLAGKAAAVAKASKRAANASNPESGKLKPGGLDPLVLGYLKNNADSGPHGPTAIAKALQRSSGAVSNCLVRLADARKVKLAAKKPRRYSLT